MEHKEVKPIFVESLCSHAHEVLGHLGEFRTLASLRRFFWWPPLLHNVVGYFRTCPVDPLTKSTTDKEFFCILVYNQEAVTLYVAFWHRVELS